MIITITLVIVAIGIVLAALGGASFWFGLGLEIGWGVGLIARFICQNRTTGS